MVVSDGASFGSGGARLIATLGPASFGPVAGKSRAASEIADAGSSIRCIRGSVDVVSPAASALDITNAAAAIALTDADILFVCPSIGGSPCWSTFLTGSLERRLNRATRFDNKKNKIFALRAAFTVPYRCARVFGGFKIHTCKFETHRSPRWRALARERRRNASFAAIFAHRRWNPRPSAVYISLTRNRIPISFTTPTSRAVVSK